MVRILPLSFPFGKAFFQNTLKLNVEPMLIISKQTRFNVYLKRSNLKRTFPGAAS
ncbi:hypothetical protein HMPREF3201_02432 [Megasphaera sp. MJR8396C]|nr:hypothetical protein HMPREF3201_02432 [Megasphaera sp. MJR8396C]